MSVEFVFRLVGMVVFAIIGVQSVALFRPENPEMSTRLIIVVTLAGAAFGLLIAPYLTTRPFNAMRAKLKRMPAVQLVAGVIGLVVGRVVGCVRGWPCRALRWPTRLA